MNYKREKQDYNSRVKTLKRVAFLDEGPNKGVPAKVSEIYLLEYSSSLRNYISKECLVIGPLKANLNWLYAIKGQDDDYKIYLLDRELDPNQEILILQRGCTAKIIKGYTVVLSFNYDYSPIEVRTLAVALAILALDNSITLGKALVRFLHPQNKKLEPDF